MQNLTVDLPAALEQENYHGQIYEYLPLGKYIVAAPNVCGGRPTIKYHRLDARHILSFVKRGDSPQIIAENYKIPLASVYEVIELACQIDYEKSYV